MTPNEREITAARSRGSNLGLSSIRARQPESRALGFQPAVGAVEGDLDACKGSVKGPAEPKKHFGFLEDGLSRRLWRARNASFQA